MINKKKKLLLQLAKKLLSNQIITKTAKREKKSDKIVIIDSYRSTEDNQKNVFISDINNDLLDNMVDAAIWINSK